MCIGPGVHSNEFRFSILRGIVTAFYPQEGRCLVVKLDNERYPKLYFRVAIDREVETAQLH